MGLEQAAMPVFAGHQTFHPRFGWIKKGFDAASTNSFVFAEPDAPVKLGVGKNMAEAIRFWCVATKVLVRKPHPTRSRQSVYLPTNLGEALLGEGGLDPFMEDPSSLWMLHWQALSHQSSLPIWWSVFNDFPGIEFSEDELVRYCADEIAATTWSQPKETSVRKDVDCLLRMYTTRQTRHRQSIDEMLDSPFRDLGLITPAASGDRTYRFVRGKKPTMSAIAVAYACLDFLAVSDPDARTASMNRLAADPGSPGRLLKLTEDSIAAAIEEVSGLSEQISLASPAGTSQLVVDGEPAAVASQLLNRYHADRGIDRVAGGNPVAGIEARQAAPTADEIFDVREIEPQAKAGAKQ